jgi:large subunit ribosomal protein L29
MKAKELRKNDTDQLKQELDSQVKHLFTLRAQAVTEKLENPTQLGKTKRTIARIKTIARQRELEIVNAAAAEKMAAAKKLAAAKLAGDKAAAASAKADEKKTSAKKTVAKKTAKPTEAAAK